MRARSAHLGHAALVDSSSPQLGRLRLALASAIPLPADGRAVLVVDFAASSAASAGAVRASSVTVDDRLVEP